MFHKAIELRFLEGTALSVTFQDGSVRKYDMSMLFRKYPQLRALEDRSLFESGKLETYGIIWSDELDIDAETIYEDGEVIEVRKRFWHEASATAISEARMKAGLTQKELAKLTGIDQADISRIERGIANPSVETLERLASAMGMHLRISFEQ